MLGCRVGSHCGRHRPGGWALAASGLAASTRRGYVQAFKGFHRFLAVRKAAEIEAAFGFRIECPVDEFNASGMSG